MTQRLKAVPIGACACMLSLVLAGAFVSAARAEQPKLDTRVFVKEIATGAVTKSEPMEFTDAMKLGVSTAISSPNAGNCWLERSRKFLSIPFIPWLPQKTPLTKVRRIR